MKFKRVRIPTAHFIYFILFAPPKEKGKVTGQSSLATLSNLITYHTVSMI